MEKNKIVIVEDEQVIALHLQDILEEIGNEVVDSFISGEEVLEYIDKSESTPDLIFMDIRLNGKLDGIDTIKELRDKGRDIPVIYLTSNTDNGYLEKAKSTFPVAFLKKPFEVDQIKATINVTLHTENERKKIYNKVFQENEFSKMQIDELMQTQQHLITATWRERELKEELSKTKAIIEEQNKKILDSINYAKRIQKAIIPTKEELKDALGDYFMYYKPKDVVSGDFPWLIQKNGFTYVAAVDCTGHGVPGAMMSLIGYLLLNGILEAHSAPTPSDILNELHKDVVKTLRQDDPENKAADGMDVAICRIDQKKKQVLYSGAHRPLYILKEGEVDQKKGDKFPIGGMQYKGENQFTDSEINFDGGETIYFFSDGLPDQFGGPEKLKFGPKRIRDIILKNGSKPMDKQEAAFSKAFDEWKGEAKQIDDVLLLGVRF